jgi:hypothetical protein
MLLSFQVADSTNEIHSGITHTVYAIAGTAWLVMKGWLSLDMTIYPNNNIIDLM